MLIIGYGNPMRGDDGLGPLAAEYFQQRFGEDGAVAVRTVHQLTPDLAEQLAGTEMAVLIDARQAAPAGQVFLEEVGAAAQPPVPLHIIHFAVTPGGQPLQQVGLVPAQVGVGDADLLEPQLAAPCLYAPCKLVEINCRSPCCGCSGRTGFG